jgi:hypothetical protein
MAIRNRAQLTSDFADNTSGAISPALLRNFLDSGNLVGDAAKSNPVDADILTGADSAVSNNPVTYLFSSVYTYIASKLASLGINATSVGATTPASGRFTFTRSAVVALTPGTTVATDVSLGDLFTLAIAQNTTLSNPTNLTAGRTWTVRVQQDAGGNRTLAYGSNYKFFGSNVLSTSANAIDVLTFISYNGTEIIGTVNRGAA